MNTINTFAKPKTCSVCGVEIRDGDPWSVLGSHPLLADDGITLIPQSPRGFCGSCNGRTQELWWTRPRKLYSGMVDGPVRIDLSVTSNGVRFAITPILKEETLLPHQESHSQPDPS